MKFFIGIGIETIFFVLKLHVPGLVGNRVSELLDDDDIVIVEEIFWYTHIIIFDILFGGLNW